MYSVMNVISRPIIFSIVILAICYQRSLALTCYDNTEGGEIQELTNDEWTFCAFMPETGKVRAKVFGIGPDNDDLSPYMMGFGSNEPAYQVLTMCTYERYDFSALTKRANPIEYMFKCVCNYDKCNEVNTFENYLSNLKPSAQ